MKLLDILSLLGSFALIAAVLVLTYYASRWYAKRMGAGVGRYVKVVDKTILGQGSAVYIVKVDKKYYLLGVGDKNISMLSELVGFEEVSQVNHTPEIPFRQIIRDIMDKAKLSRAEPSGDEGDDNPYRDDGEK